MGQVGKCLIGHIRVAIPSGKRHEPLENSELENDLGTFLDKNITLMTERR